MSNSTHQLSVKGRIWLEIDNISLIGAGKIHLLELAARLGSLRKAAKEMNISYRQAWYSINKINTTAKEPLLILKKGGRNGGMALLTDHGREILEKFGKIEKEFNEFLAYQTKNIRP